MQSKGHLINHTDFPPKEDRDKHLSEFQKCKKVVFVQQVLDYRNDGVQKISYVNQILR